MTVDVFPHLLNTAETAELLGVSPNTLKAWRVRSIGPRFCKIGRKNVAYDVSDLAEWIDQQKEPRDEPATG